MSSWPFSTLSIDKAANGYTLTATDGSLTSATSNTFNVSVGAAAKLAFTQQPVNGTGGTALATQPNFILLDEPLAGIDPIAVNDIRTLVAHLKDRGIGVLITDHNVRDTLKIVDRAYILHEGQVLMEGAPDEIVAHADVRRVYLGERFSL